MSYSMRVNEATLAALRLALLWLLWAIYMEAKVVVTEDMLNKTPQNGQLRELLVSVEAKIAGGTDAPCGRFPYMASLRTQALTHVCGGVLIDPQWILTAAHCVDANSGLSPNMIIAVGGCNLDEERGTKEDNRTVEFFRNLDIVTHENWTGEPADGFDIALVRLRGTSVNIHVPFSERQNVLDNVDTLSALGWGKRADGEISNVLQFTNSLRVLGNRYCDDEEDGWGNIIQDSMVCAQGLGDGIDTCPGDSGGPLLLVYEPKGEVADGDPDLDEVVGITSFGEEKDCGESLLPGVYTRVSSFGSWIRATMTGMEPPIPIEPPATVPSPEPSPSPPSEEVDSPTSSPSPSPSPDPSPTIESQEFTATSSPEPFPDEESLTASTEPPVSPSPSPSVTTSPEPDAAQSPPPSTTPLEPTVAASPETSNTESQALPASTTEPVVQGCLCSEDGISGGTETGLGGCHSRKPDGILLCYLASSENCGPQFDSVIFPGAKWASCTDDGGAQELPKESELSDEERTKLNEELVRIAGLTDTTADQIKDLILGGVDPDLHWDNDVPVLHLAAGGGSFIVAVGLVEAGADVDAKDGLGWTALHLASSIGNVEVVKFLVAVGADIGVRDMYQQTPRDAACSLVAKCPAGALVELQSLLSLAR